MDPLAARGFARDPAAYERGRPDYPAAALDRIAGEFHLGPGSRLLELGAGTGKFTRMLLARGLRPVALEPVEGMRRALRSLPEVRVVAGVAEVLPFRGSSIDAVVVAQAFHWFDGPRAAAEIHRVLRPGGGLALLWNARDESVPWVAALGRVLDRLGGDAPRYRSGAWRGAFDGAGFTPLVHASFPHAQSLSPEGVLDRVASISYVSALAARERETVLAEVRGLLPPGAGTVTLPYRTDLFLCAGRGP